MVLRANREKVDQEAQALINLEREAREKASRAWQRKIQATPGRKCRIFPLFSVKSRRAAGGAG